MTTSKLFIAISIFTGFLSLSSCENQSTKRATNLSELDTISFKNLSTKAYAYLDSQQNACRSIYKIDQYQNWYYDQYNGKLTFSDSSETKLVIDYEEVGSLSFKSNTWLWAWNNPYLEENVKSQIGKVKTYGLKRGFEKLIRPKWTADEYDGREMTAIAAYLMKAKGAYRVPSKDSMLYSFMIFKDIRWPDSSKRQ